MGLGIKLLGLIMKFVSKVLLFKRLKNLFIQHWLDAGGSIDLSEENFKVNQENQQTILIAAGEDPTLRNSGIRFFISIFNNCCKKTGMDC